MLGLSGFTCSSQYSIVILYYYNHALFVVFQSGVMYMCFAESFVYTSLLLCEAHLLPPLLLCMSSKASSDTTTDTASEG